MTLNTEICKNKPSLIVLSATCNLIYKHQIKERSWIDVKNYVQKYLKPLKFEIQFNNIEQELKKSRYNEDYPQKLQGSLTYHQCNEKEIFKNALEWIAIVNKNSSKMIAVNSKEQVMRKLLAQSAILIKENFKPEYKTVVNSKDSSETIDEIILEHKFVNKKNKNKL